VVLDHSLTHEVLCPSESIVTDAVVIRFERLLSFARKSVTYALPAAVLVAVAAYFVSNYQTPTFSARAILHVSGSPADGAAFDIPQLSVRPLTAKGYREAAVSEGVLTAVLTRLGLPARPADTAEFRKSVAVLVEDPPGLIYVEAKATDAAAAADRANAITAELLAWDDERNRALFNKVIDVLQQNAILLYDQTKRLEAEGGSTSQSALATQQALLVDQQNKLATATLLRQQFLGGLNVLTPASPPQEPVAPRPVFTAALAFLLTFGLVLVGQFTVDMVRSRIYTTEELEETTGLPTLAVLPPLTKRKPVGREEANALREHVRRLLPNNESLIVSVTSPVASADTFEVASALAKSFARAGVRTLFVDSDLRSATLGTRIRHAGISKQNLSDVLRGKLDPGTHLVLSVGANQDLAALFDETKTAEGSDILGQSWVPTTKEWRQRYEVIVAYVAPVLGYSDSTIVAPDSDGVILVCPLHEATRKGVAATITDLERSGASIVGTVVTHTHVENRPAG